MMRNVLEVAYDGEVLVGCSTVRPPAEETSVAETSAVVETHILASNEDGLRFAKAHGFVEVETYLLPGDSVPFVELRLGA
ncbi:hypothetical protein [Kribbella solani]|uniref:N-acetyltransferase domain-containing protein n=1 Tax=Kribbella solani TaxID=236067 RepID=A0A841DN91_9ACTN|nr:hypothetical protein [Kribbella solani]MBB5980133.1 hypothetical protein [Kribbella solani]